MIINVHILYFGLDTRKTKTKVARIPADVKGEVGRFCNKIKQNTYTLSVDIALAIVLIF